MVVSEKGLVASGRAEQNRPAAAVGYSVIK